VVDELAKECLEQVNALKVLVGELIGLSRDKVGEDTEVGGEGVDVKVGVKEAGLELTSSSHAGLFEVVVRAVAGAELDSGNGDGQEGKANKDGLHELEERDEVGGAQIRVGGGRGRKAGLGRT